MTISARQSLESAFIKLGGVPGLVRWGKKNRTAFYQLWQRLIPRDVSVSADAGLEDLLTRLADAQGTPAVAGDYTELHGAPSAGPSE